MARFSNSLLIFLAAGAISASSDSLADLRSKFEHPPDDARIMMRWWWFGPGVTKQELAREMRTMKEGGIGGFEVQPVYPLALDDPELGFKNVPYLSEEYLDTLAFAARTARELGLRMDVTLGSGWPFGGPHTPVTEAAGKVAVRSSAGRAGRILGSDAGYHRGRETPRRVSRGRGQQAILAE